MNATRLCFTLLIVSLLSACAVTVNADSMDGSPGELRLSYSDGRPDTTGVDNVNAVLRSVGVRVGVIVAVRVNVRVGV